MLLWLDGFEDATLSPYTVNYASILTVNPRTGSYSVLVGGAGHYIRYSIPNTGALYVGGGFLRAAGATIAFSVLDGTNTQLSVSISGPTITVARGGTAIGTHAVSTLDNVWYYIELYVLIADSGAYEIRLNGQTVASQSSIDTQATANPYANAVQWSGYGRWDDLYICDSSGSDCNTFLGPIKISHLKPNGNGASSGMTGSDGNSVDNYLLVDETTPNGDVDYVYSAVSGTKDTYNLQNLPPEAYTVAACMLTTVARKDGGTASLKTVIRHSGSEVDSAAKTLTDAYAYYYDRLGGKNPVTSSQWTVSDINNLETGVKVG